MGIELVKMGQHSLQLPSLGVFIILWSTKSQVVTLNVTNISNQSNLKSSFVSVGQSFLTEKKIEMEKRLCLLGNGVTVRNLWF